MTLMLFVAALALGLDAVWVTGDARVFGVVGIIAGTIGMGLVGYFNWRAKLRRRILSETDDERRAARVGAFVERGASPRRWGAAAGSCQRCDHPGREAASPRSLIFSGWLLWRE